jgi:tetratricopeptide (TPR) repeat protein
MMDISLFFSDLSLTRRTAICTSRVRTFLIVFLGLNLAGMFVAVERPSARLLREGTAVQKSELRESESSSIGLEEDTEKKILADPIEPLMAEKKPKKGQPSEWLVQKLFQSKLLLEKQRWPELGDVVQEIIMERRRQPLPVAPVVNLSDELMKKNRREEALRLLVGMKDTRSEKIPVVLENKIRLYSKIYFDQKTQQLVQEGVNYLWTNRVSEARERFSAALVDDPAQPEVMIRYAQSLYVERKYDEAIQKLKASTQLNPLEPQARLWLLRSEWMKGKTENRISEFEVISKSLPKSELASIWLAEAYQNVGRRGAAIEFLDQKQKEYPNHIGVLLKLAELRIDDSQRMIKSTQRLWEAKRLLQVGLSRVSRYTQQYQQEIEGEAGFSPWTPDELKQKLTSLVADCDARIKKLNGT